jgi:hypothetical protein
MSNDEPQQGRAESASSPVDEADSSASSVEAEDTDGPAGPGDHTAHKVLPWWEKLLDHRYVPGPVKQLAVHELNNALAKHPRRYYATNDKDDNAATRLPDGEQIRLPVIWMAELFTPTTVEGLVDGMRDLAGKAKKDESLRSSTGIEPVEWVRSSRRRHGVSSCGPFIILPPGTLSFPWAIHDNMPSGVSHISLKMYTLTPAVTVLMAEFEFEDDSTQELEGILNKNFASRMEIHQPTGLTPLSVETQKARATEDWRMARRQEAADWLVKRFPGYFHRLAESADRQGMDRMPSIELLLTAHYRPWEATIHSDMPPLWADISDLGQPEDFWQCASNRSLRLKRFQPRYRSYRGNALVLAAIGEELLAGDPMVTGFKGEQLQAIISGAATRALRDAAMALLSRWALTVFLGELDEQMPSIQDAADRASRKYSARTLAQLQVLLLRNGLDSRIVVNEIIEFTKDDMWEDGLLTFTNVHNPVVVRLPPPPASLTGSWRQEQAEIGERVTRMEADLRELLSTSADLAAASANLRLQRNAIWIAIGSFLAAVVAITITIWHP